MINKNKRTQNKTANSLGHRLRSRFGIQAASSALVLTVLFAPKPVVADGMPSDSPSESLVADNRSALPGMVRVVTAEPLEGAGGLALSSAYGFRGTTIGTDDSHHRLWGSLAANLRIDNWLAIGTILDGRYDRHVSPDTDADDGWVGDPRLLARARRDIQDNLAIAGEFGIWFPAESLLDFAGASFEGRAALSVEVRPDINVAVNLGARLDRSENTVTNPELLSLADKMSLGVSSSNALLFGAGIAWEKDRLNLAAEWTWDLLVGAEAPAIGESPMRLATTARMQIDDAIWLGATLEVAISSTPAITDSTPLVPVESRVTGWVSATYRLGTDKERPMVKELVREPVPEEPPQTFAVRGVVTDPSGKPLAGAIVALGVRRTETGSDGSYEFTELPAGPVTLTIEAPGHEPQSLAITVGSDSAENALSTALEASLPDGQIRGVVRSLSGKTLKGARIRIEGLNVDLKTDAQGRFEFEVPPGEHRVEISATDHHKQVRTLQVDQDGVTVLNVDLRTKRRRR